MLDTAIATMDAKVHGNGARPDTLIRHYLRAETLEAWGGAGRGTRAMKGEEFQPYLPTSASPEHVSGHSSFSAAAAMAIRLALGSDALGFEATVRAGSFKYDSGPARDIHLRFITLSEAAAAAGWSRVHGGIHFSTGDRTGASSGRMSRATSSAEPNATSEGGSPPVAPAW